MAREHADAVAWHLPILRDKGITNRQALVAVIVANHVWPKAKSDGTPAHTWVGDLGALSMLVGYPPTKSNRAHMSEDVSRLVWLRVLDRTTTVRGPGLVVLPPYRERPPGWG